MDSTWDTACITASSDDIKYMTNLGLESNVYSAAADRVFYYQRGIKDVQAGMPILLLLHGYPQT